MVVHSISEFTLSGFYCIVNLPLEIQLDVVVVIRVLPAVYAADPGAFVEQEPSEVVAV